MQFIKTRDVKNPERNVAENAGIDIYIPNKTPEFVEALLAKNPGFETNKELQFPLTGKERIVVYRRK